MISVYRKDKKYNYSCEIKKIVVKRGLKRWTDKENILGGQK
jgi:hypothetical protein